jgi:hypothetical protein
VTLKRLVWPIAIGAAFIVAVLMLKPASHRAASVPGADLSSRHSASPIAPASSLIADRSEPQSRPRSWRPPALDAARNSSRAGYAWILRQFGISDADLDRLAAGNYAAFFKDLTSKANAGDPNAINALGWLAWGCATQRSEAQLNSYQQSQHQEARSLPSADADWFTTFLDADISNDKQHLIACAAIDQDDSLESQIKGLAAQGDGASLFVLSLAANNMTDLRNYARQSALQGFPEGQYEYARDLLYSSQLYPSQPGDPTAMDLLRAAANELPMARASLALCEYSGCSGETPNVSAALADARTAAQSGTPDAMIQLAVDAPPSLISAAEGQAWSLFDLALQQRGCRVSVLGLNWMKSMATLAANATPEAQTLADQYWQQYGATAMAQLGC